jgi:hypothetical protein
MWLARWTREIERKREERAEKRESSGRKRQKSGETGSSELRRIKLSADEKQKLQDRIADRGHKTARSDKAKMVIVVYMAMMVFAIAGEAIVISIYIGVAPIAEAVQDMLSCLLVIALCVLWLKLSNSRKSRGLLAMIPGIMVFIAGSALICFGIIPLDSRYAVGSLVLGVPALMASYFLCFSRGEAAGEQ